MGGGSSDECWLITTLHSSSLTMYTAVGSALHLWLLLVLQEQTGRRYIRLLPAVRDSVTMMHAKPLH